MPRTPRLRLEAHRRSTWIRAASSAVVLLAVSSFQAPVARAQDGGSGGPMVFHASSPDAARHASMAWDELNNVNAAGALPHLRQAMSMDPGFGLARVLYGFAAPGLSPDQRGEEIDRGMGMLGEASAAEVLLALSWREWNAGRRPAAIAATRAASQLASGEPRLAFQLAQLEAPGSSASAQVAAVRSVTEKFPDFAPAYNILAYNSWAADDHTAALAAVRRYVELIPDHPNPHDSYAELLQWDGQFDEAAAEYRRAAELDPSFAEAYMGLAEVSWLAGKHDEARAQIRRAIEAAPAGNARLQAERALAHSFLMDGKTKEAMQGLAAVARAAEAQGNKNLAATVHRQMAVADAMLGSGKEVEAHLGRADALTGNDTPGSHAWTALAYASGKDLDRAGAALDRLEKSAGDNAGLMNIVRTGRAMVLLSRNQPDRAMASLGEPGDDIGRAVGAQCLKRIKRGSDAAKMKSAVLMAPAFSFYDSVRPFAVLRASKA